jgi:hypothetical protein
MKWAHLLCAMWIPEVSLGNATFQEPVQDVEKVPKTRWKLVSMQHTEAPPQVTDSCNSRAISANKEWALASNADTSHASRRSTSLALVELDYACV